MFFGILTFKTFAGATFAGNPPSLACHCAMRETSGPIGM
jgi:hypothetical protein